MENRQQKITMNGYVHENRSRGRPRIDGLTGSKVIVQSLTQRYKGLQKGTGQEKLEEIHSGAADACLDIAKASSQVRQVTSDLVRSNGVWSRIKSAPTAPTNENSLPERNVQNGPAKYCPRRSTQVVG